MMALLQIVLVHARYDKTVALKALTLVVNFSHSDLSKELVGRIKHCLRQVRAKPNQSFAFDSLFSSSKYVIIHFCDDFRKKLSLATITIVVV